MMAAEAELAQARAASDRARERWIASPRGTRALRALEHRRTVMRVLALELAQARTAPVETGPSAPVLPAADTPLPERKPPYWQEGQYA